MPGQLSDTRNQEMYLQSYYKSYYHVGGFWFEGPSPCASRDPRAPLTLGRGVIQDYRRTLWHPKPSKLGTIGE